jgi:hypothetical protein
MKKMLGIPKAMSAYPNQTHAKTVFVHDSHLQDVEKPTGVALTKHGRLTTYRTLTRHDAFTTLLGKRPLNVPCPMRQRREPYLTFSQAAPYSKGDSCST